MERSEMPSRPVVTSQLAADAIIAHWNEQNTQRQLKDKEGLNWDVNVTAQQEVREPLQQREIWKITVKMIADAKAESFVASGVLDGDRDERLIQLLGNSLVPLALKPRSFDANNLEEAKNLTIELLDRIATELHSKDRKEAKRQLIYRFIDQASLFDTCENRLQFQ